MKDPDTYLTALGTSLAGVMDPGRPAVLDPAHRTRVNFETYFFADTDNRRRFAENPLPHLGWITDPVSLERFQPAPESPRSKLGGRAYYFASEATRRAFDADPVRFAHPRGMMR